MIIEFNTPIQEAFIIEVLLVCSVGLKPIVEIQFADYIWPGLNQLFTEVSRSCFLSNGKWPVSCIIRVPIEFMVVEVLIIHLL